MVICNYIHTLIYIKYLINKVIFNYCVECLKWALFLYIHVKSINRFTGSYFSKMIAYCVDARWGRV